MHVYGLTGNIACGKSLVEEMLRTAGVPVIDADQVARDIVLPGEPALAEIVDLFGSEVLHEDGTLNRGALGDIVFSDEDMRRDLEQITHPRIFKGIAQAIFELQSNGHEFAIVSAALMVETGSYRMYGGLAVVTCDPDIQLARLMARDGSDECSAQERIDSQLPQQEKVDVADVVFDNSGTVDETRLQVLDWLAAKRAEYGIEAPTTPLDALKGAVDGFVAAVKGGPERP